MSLLFHFDIRRSIFCGSLFAFPFASSTAPTATVPPTPAPSTPKPATPTPVPRPTATTAPPTATVPPTPAPSTPRPVTPTPVTATGKLEVLCRDGAPNPTDSQIAPQFQIVNNGNEPAALSDLTIRYWYTIDGERPQNFWCDWAQVGSANVTGTFHPLTPPRAGADYYLEVGFTPGAGQIAGGGNSGEIQCRFAKDNWTDYNENDDHSYNPDLSSFGQWDRVTLYRDGELIWGVEP